MSMSTSRRYPYVPEVLGLMLVAALAVAGTMAAGGQAPAGTPAAETALSDVLVDPPADLQSAIARVRHLYFGHDFHHGAAEGNAALQRWPESSELAAWTLANLARASAYGADVAVARAESLVESRADDVWAAIALALALTHHSDRHGEALEASLRPLELAPTLPEAVWVRGLALHYRRQYEEAAALIEEKLQVVDQQWPELLNLKGDAYLAMRFEGPAPVAEGLEILARVRERDPQNVRAHYLAGNALYRWDRHRMDEGAALLERAAALSPGSLHIARDRWYSVAGQPGLDAEEKNARISASASELLARRGHYPGTLADVALSLGSLGKLHGLEDLISEGTALEDRVLTQFTDTEEAERVLWARWDIFSRRISRGEVDDTVAFRAELSAMLWSFIDRPRHYRMGRLGNAYMTLFEHSLRDPTVSPDTLLLLARGAAEYDPWLPHARLASGLAERGVHLDAAREFARVGLDAAEEYISKSFFDTPGEAADALDGALASIHAAMGYVELKAGELAAAREAIDRALELKSDNKQIQFQAGSVAEAEGDLEAAELHYALGEQKERLGPADDKPNRDALERIYTDRHGSMEGYEEFLAQIMKQDRDRRWQRVADSRIEEPRDLPAIDLEWLDGGRIGAEELEGRIVVINFWGVWCGPCVAEAPQIQELHEKYRDDPGVVFLTVNAFDPDLDEVRRWMTENEFDYPVLVDDNFATPHSVRSYPTTWFADADGRIVFEHGDASAAVYEEFVWRVEMLQAEAPAGTPAAETVLSDVRVDPSADLQSAIARVRHLYFGHDFHHGAAEGDAALQHWPESSELAAWTLANLARSQNPDPLWLFPSAGSDEAVARADSLMESRPDDVWAAIALALALTHHSDRRGESLEASLRPLELAPTLPEAVWARAFILHQQQQYQEVSALIEEKWPVVDRQWAELLTIRGDAYLARTAKEMGPERMEEGLKILARAREHDPENVGAHYLAGVALLRRGREVDEAAALLERAAALSPGSTEIATSRWRTILVDPDLDEEERKTLISASAGELLERRGQYPSTLQSVASFLSFLELDAEAAELQDRVLTKFAHTVEAELVTSGRWTDLYWRLYSGQVDDTVAARTELSSMLWAFIDRPHHHRTMLLGGAYTRLFSLARHDETVSLDTLLLLARGALEHDPWPVNDELAIGLAERGAVDAARKIAWDGIAASEKSVSERSARFDTPGAAADALAEALAHTYAAIGYVELKAGDLVAAREAIDRALELKPDRLQVQLRAGALAEAEGDLEAAEIHYASGERLERLGPGDKPNRKALERIYTERYGSMAGYEEFIAGIEERDRARRWQEIADSRIEEPRDLPAIDLEWLDGGRIEADELEGRIVVINFWGVWCGPCVAEAPQIQQLHEQYLDDPGVLFLTINAYDLDLDEVRMWMADNGYDYPVLLDDGFVTRHGVRAFPTTWFANPDGQIVFEYTGDTAAVYEEFVWRVEMLRALEQKAGPLGSELEPDSGG